MQSEVAYVSLSPERLLSDQGWWDIYNEAFPANEREPPQIIAQSLRGNVGLALCARSPYQTLAIATTHLLKDPAAVFLVYLATINDLRGRGYGGKLLEFAWDTSLDTFSDKGLEPTGLILEVDAPHSANSRAERDVRERRISFFARHGLKLLPVPYLQPPVDGVAPVEMSLMFRPAEGHCEPDSNLISALVRAIYFEKYHAVNGISHDSLEALLRLRG